jgi:YbbR domain-containing protein
MTRLLGVIVYNWPLKLAAIALATLLYAGLVVSQSSFELPTAVPINVVNQPADAFVLGNLPPVTRIRYVANGEVGVAPTPDSFRATIDLANVDPAAGSTYVKIDVTSVDPRFLVVGYEPQGINVQLDPFTSKDVPVQVNTGDIPPNLVVRPAELSRETVRVSGPDSVVKLVVAARADATIDQQGLTVDRDVPLIPVDILGNPKTSIRLEPATVHVTIPVFTNRQTKSLAVNPVVTGTPPTGYRIQTIAVTPTSVTIEGDAATGTIDIDVPLDLPASVRPVTAGNVHVTIRIVAETGTRTFSAGLVLSGRQPGLDYTIDSDAVSVVVGGPVADLARLDASQFTVTLDVSGLAAGSHAVAPSANLQAGLRLLSAARRPRPREAEPRCLACSAPTGSAASRTSISSPPSRTRSGAQRPTASSGRAICSSSGRTRVAPGTCSSRRSQRVQQASGPRSGSRAACRRRPSRSLPAPASSPRGSWSRRHTTRPTTTA